MRYTSLLLVVLTAAPVLAAENNYDVIRRPIQTNRLLQACGGPLLEDGTPPTIEEKARVRKCIEDLMKRKASDRDKAG